MTTHTDVDVPVLFTAHTPHPDNHAALLSHDWLIWLRITTPHDAPADLPGAAHDKVRDAVQDWAHTHLHLAVLLTANDPRIDHYAHHDTPHYVIGVDEHSHNLTIPSTAAVAVIISRVTKCFIARSAQAAALARVAVTGPDGARVVITHHPATGNRPADA